MNRIGLRLRDAHYVRSERVCHWEGEESFFVIAHLTFFIFHFEKGLWGWIHDLAYACDITFRDQRPKSQKPSSKWKIRNVK